MRLVINACVSENERRLSSFDRRLLLALRPLRKGTLAQIRIDRELLEKYKEGVICLSACLGGEIPQAIMHRSVEEAERIAGDLGYPVVIRPAYTMGGTGGGLVYNVEELRTIAARGIAASLVSQILIEESVLGWEELELEVVRDAKNQMITVCFIENVDAMGVHTGDSITVAPQQTLSDREYQEMRNDAFTVIRRVGVATGGSNIQFFRNQEYT